MGRDDATRDAALKPCQGERTTAEPAAPLTKCVAVASTACDSASESETPHQYFELQTVTSPTPCSAPPVGAQELKSSSWGGDDTTHRTTLPPGLGEPRACGGAARVALCDASLDRSSNKRSSVHSRRRCVNPVRRHASEKRAEFSRLRQLQRSCGERHVSGRRRQESELTVSPQCLGPRETCPP